MGRLQRVAEKFARQLKAKYESGEWDVVKCFYAYIGFLVRFGGEDLSALVDWQIRDMLHAIVNDTIDYRVETLEVLWNRSRRSGKTMCATILAVFYVLLGYTIRWYSPHADQKDFALVWLYQNPFVKQIKTTKRQVIVVGTTPTDLEEEMQFTYRVLSAGAVAGGECDCLFYDEGQDIAKHLKIYKLYEKSRPFLTNTDFGHILHFSTPARNTAFWEANQMLKRRERELDTRFVFERNYRWCPWNKEERIRQEAERHPEDPYFFQRNYLCMWVIYGGAVFNPDNYIELRDASPEVKRAYQNIEPEHGGVDWNGEATRHYLVLTAITDDYVFVKDEIKFWGEWDTLRRWHHRVHIELESDDPFSNQFADDAVEAGVDGSYVGWDDELKIEKLRQLKRRTIVIDQVKCPTTYKNMQEAAYDQNKRLPTLEKRSDQHGLDALLHSIHTIPDDMYYIGEKENENDLPVAENPFEKKRRRRGDAFDYY